MAFCIVLPSFLSTMVGAFPNRPGGCPGGIPAAVGHAVPDPFPSFADLAYDFLVDGQVVDVSTTLSIGQRYEFAVRANANPFRGALIRVEGLGILEPGTNSANAIVCTAAEGVGHTENGEKTIFSGLYEVFGGGTVVVDVTVVESNVNGVSIYTYERFTLLVEKDDALTVAPVASPTRSPIVARTDAPIVAPTNAPVVSPTFAPTEAPIATPTTRPIVAPTDSPTITPTNLRVVAPTNLPTIPRTDFPVATPTNKPIVSPTNAPTKAPVQVTTVSPVAPMVSNIPVAFPSTAKLPSVVETEKTTRSSLPSHLPSTSPIMDATSNIPSSIQSGAFLEKPSTTSSQGPTEFPSEMPTIAEENDFWSNLLRIMCLW